MIRNEGDQGDWIHVPFQLSPKETSKQLQRSLMDHGSSLQDLS